MLPLSIEERKEQHKSILDKKKNNSTVNLHKWTKPTVSIKIAQEDFSIAA